MKACVGRHRIFFLLVTLLSPFGGVQGETFLVTNTGDSGDGSLRQALLDVHAGTGQDTVLFQIPAGGAGYDAGTGTWSIRPATALPQIEKDGTIIDGTSQAAFIGGDPNPSGPEIVISGAGSGIIDGIGFFANDGSLKHVAIAGFETQIRVTGINNFILGCFIGTDPTGTGPVDSSYTGVMLSYQASNNFIGGWTEGDRNVISGNRTYGICLNMQSAYNTVINNHIGTDRTGTVRVENGRGVCVQAGSHHNTVSGNVISGNSSHGVILLGEDVEHNRITANRIGVDAAGEAELGNDQAGIYILDGPKHNTVGGTEPGEGNVLSANSTGVDVSGDGSDENTIAGNIIGLNGDGSMMLGNGTGVSLRNGAGHNRVGPANVISGNTSWGVSLYNDSTSFNTVFGNRIGTDAGGSTAMGNTSGGVKVYFGAGQNTIGGAGAGEGNLISGNGEYGIFLSGSSSSVAGNRILGNRIGTDAEGRNAVPNLSHGIVLFYENVLQTEIGGATAEEGNLVSGNGGSGIYMFGTNITGNTVRGNIIGMDVDAENALPNQGNGIKIASGPSDNTIGPGNVIANNLWNGVIVDGAACTGNTVSANSIFGNQFFGINLLGNANGGVRAPEITGMGSVSGTAPPNTRVEIFSGPDDEGRDYQGFVDADAAGAFSFPGSPAGPFITATATDAQGNTSAFSSALHVGPFVVTTTADTGEGSLRQALEKALASVGPDTIVFHIPATDANFDGGSGVWTIHPETRLPDIAEDGMVIDGFSQADFHGSDANPFGPEIEIDGSMLTSSYSCFNVYADHITLSGLAINHFGSHGIFLVNSRMVSITGCYVGTDPTGTVAKPNGWGIVANTCSQMHIGPANGHASIVSGNEQVGIALDDTSRHNTVTGSIIGLDRTMSEPLGNGNYGALRLFELADSNEVVDNYIGGSEQGVLVFESSHNHITDNYIGTDDAWTAGLGNSRSGIYIQADADSANENVITRNIVGHNARYGVRVSGALCQRNTITENRISGNGWGGIEVGDDANGNLSVPMIAYASESVVNGTAGAGDRVEVFADEAGQGRVYLGSTDADGTGAWALVPAAPSVLPNITATATDGAGNTSNFSDAYITTDVAKEDDRLPGAFALHPNYPNPFNPETTIGFDVAERSRITLRIYDVRGRVVATLVDGVREAGSYAVRFDASALPSGIYVCRIRMKDFRGAVKMLLIE